MVAGHRHSWFLTEEAQMEAQVLLPAAVYCYHSSQCCCLASPGAAALQHSHTPPLYCTNTHFSFQLRWQACSAGGGFRSEHSPLVRATRQADLLVTHTFSHTLCWKGMKRDQESCMNGKGERKEDAHTRFAEYTHRR